MPQLDISTYISQIFWLLLFFGFILILTAKVFVPRFDKKLRTRWLFIDGAEIEAEKLKKTVSQLTNQYTNELQQARQNNQTLMTQTMADIARLQAQQKADFKALYKIKLHEFDLQLAAKQKMLSQEVNTIAASLASQIISHLVGENIARDRIDQAVHQTLNPGHHHD